MRRLIFVLGALLFAGVVCAQQSPCDQNELQKCFAPFSNLHFDVVHGFSATDMQALCADWLIAKPCLNRFLSGPCQGKIPEQLVSIMRSLGDVADYVCTEALPEIIRDHACFFESHTAATKCQEHLGLSIQEASDPQQLLTSLKEPGGCARLSRYEVCVINTVRKGCSAQASEVIRHIYVLVNRGIQNFLQCSKPILSEREPILPPEPSDPEQLPPNPPVGQPLPPKPPVEDMPPPRLPEKPLQGEDMSCRMMHECMRPLGNDNSQPFEAHPERCRILKEMVHCLQRAQRECRSSARYIEEFLMQLRRAERHYHCGEHPIHEPDRPIIEPNIHEPGREHWRSHHLHRGVKIAIGVGVAVVALVVVTVLVAVCHVRRRRVQRLDKSKLIDKETYHSNLEVAVAEATKSEKNDISIVGHM